MAIIIKPSKKSLIIAAIASMLLLPVAVKVYAHEQTDVGLESTQNTETVLSDTTEGTPEEETSTPQEEATVDDIVDTETEPVATEEPEVQDPETPIAVGGVTLAEAQIIAEAEHPDAILKKVTTGVVDGQSVYVFKFADGWKVSVRALDGVVIAVKDGSQKNHSCKNKLKDNAEFQSWLQSRKDKRNSDGNQRKSKKHGHSDKKHQGHRHHRR